MGHATAETPLDGPWKRAIERYLREFLRFSFPAVERDLDWRRAPESLDTAPSVWGARPVGAGLKAAPTTHLAVRMIVPSSRVGPL